MTAGLLECVDLVEELTRLLERNTRLKASACLWHDWTSAAERLMAASREIRLTASARLERARINQLAVPK